VIFWMAGLFMLPRFFVYHQEAAPDSPENAVWTDRERKLLQDHHVAVPGRAVGAGAGHGLVDGLPSPASFWFHVKLALAAGADGLCTSGCAGERRLTRRLLNAR
jgi:putative membrane protein